MWEMRKLIDSKENKNKIYLKQCISKYYLIFLIVDHVLFICIVDVINFQILWQCFNKKYTDLIKYVYMQILKSRYYL